MSETKTTEPCELTYSEWCRQQDREALKVLEKERDQARAACAAMRECLEDVGRHLGAINTDRMSERNPLCADEVLLAKIGAEDLLKQNDCGQDLLDKLAEQQTALRKIKLTALTCEDPRGGFARVIRLCIDAGITEKMDQLPETIRTNPETDKLKSETIRELNAKLAQYESQEQSQAIKIGALEKEIEELRTRNYEKAKEIDELTRALTIKLDAMPSGLSAGQSMGMEKQICQLRNEVQKLEGKNDGLAQALREALRYVSDSEPALRLKLVLEGGQIDYSRRSAEQLAAYREQLTKIDNILHPV